MKNKRILLIVLLLICILITGCGSNKNELQFGTLVDKKENCETNDKCTLTIKAKIEKSLTNEATINNNYFNVAYYIRNNDVSKYDEIQYWAVADMTNGEENKVISFNLSKDLISKVKDQKVSDDQIGELSTDLWILPSLKS